MRMLIFMAGAIAIAAAPPAFAKPGKGKGPHHATHAGAHGCPPGLAKKRNGCLPPGQARKLFGVGQRIPTGYRHYSSYDAIPAAYRDRFGIPTGQRYIYRDDTVYVVDPTTRLVSRIFDLID
ncbi:MAG TPA: hypothetical protein VIT45_17300 [Allosphingosinicella sp.]